MKEFNPLGALTQQYRFARCAVNR